MDDLTIILAVLAAGIAAATVFAVRNKRRIIRQERAEQYMSRLRDI